MTNPVGTFDGLDNRREVFILLARLGHGLPEMEAAKARACFLRRLVRLSGNGFADKMVTITPCTLAEAYNIWVAVALCLGVGAETAAKALEEEISCRARRPALRGA